MQDNLNIKEGVGRGNGGIENLRLPGPHSPMWRLVTCPLPVPVVPPRDTWYQSPVFLLSPIREIYVLFEWPQMHSMHKTNLSANLSYVFNYKS